MTSRQAHAKLLVKLHRTILRHRAAIVQAWRSIDDDPTLRKLQAAADAYRRKLEIKAEMSHRYRRRKLVPLERELLAAQRAHDSFVSATMSNWMMKMRESSHNRRHWSLAWFTDDERFALVRKPGVRIQVTENTTQGFGVRHALYDFHQLKSGDPKLVYEFLGEMTKADWIVVYKHVAAAKAKSNQVPKQPVG